MISSARSLSRAHKSDYFAGQVKVMRLGMITRAAAGSTTARYLLAGSVVLGGILFSHAIKRGGSPAVSENVAGLPGDLAPVSRETAQWMLAEARARLGDRIAARPMLKSPTSADRTKGQPAHRHQSEQNSQRAVPPVEAARPRAANVFLSIYPQP